MDGKTPRYEVLAGRIEQLYSSVGRLNQLVKRKRNEYNKLNDRLSEWGFQNAFPVLESDLNDVIGTWNVDIPFTQLVERLEEYKKKIAFIDNEILVFEKYQKKFLRLPNRHQRKAVSEKIALFMQHIRTIGLASLDNVINDVISPLHTMIDKVLAAFADEKTMVENNRKMAERLLERIKNYDLFVDRFGLRKLCAESKLKVEQVLRKPNKVNPEVDADILQKVAQALDECMSQFEMEESRFQELMDALDDNRNTIWFEDYDELYSILKKGAFSDPTPSGELQKRYEALLGVKEREINRALSRYSRAILDFYIGEIMELRHTCTRRDDLYALLARMDRKITVDRRQLLMKVLKYSSIVICFIVFGWVVGIVIALGYIAYLVLKDDR